MNIGYDILSGLREMNHKDRPEIGLSQIGKCPRQNWYYTHKPEAAAVRDLDSELTFEWGNAFEDMVCRALLHKGYDLRHTGSDQLYVEFMGIGGHPDGFLFINGKKFVIECKSASGYGFGQMSRNGVEKSNPDYWLQIQAYMAATEADGGLFIIGNKESKKRPEHLAWDDITAIYTEWVSPDFAVVTEHVAALLPVLAAPEPPARPYETLVKFPCGYCPFMAECWELNVEPSGIAGLDA